MILLRLRGVLPLKLHLVPDLIEQSDASIDGKISLAHSLLERLSEFVIAQNDDYLMIEPWFIFRAWLDFRCNLNSPYYSVFRSWQMFNWMPDLSTVKLTQFDCDHRSLAAIYLKLYRYRLSAEEILILTDGQRQRIDLYEVQGCTRGVALRLHGIVSGEELSVYDQKLSQFANRGDYILAHALPIGERRHIFMGASPLIPAYAKGNIDLFRKLVRAQCPGSRAANMESDLFSLFYELSPAVECSE